VRAKVEREKKEKEFREYRQYLSQEITTLASWIAIFRRLHTRRADRLDEMNIAPCFFGTVLDALYSGIILWVDKLLGDRSERGLLDFLSFVKKNIELFKVSELKRRKGCPAGYWLLRREEITRETVEEDEHRIGNMRCLNSVKTRRDKYHAHFDKKYFFDRKQLTQAAPLKFGDLKGIVATVQEVLNKYSSQFDGEEYRIEPVDVNDVDYVLDSLARLRNI